MKIYLSPIRRDDSLTVIKSGEALIINGEGFDFTILPEGATIPLGKVPCEWIAGPIERIEGQLHVTLLLPHGPNPTEAAAFPSAIINPPDGPLGLPSENSRRLPNVGA